MRITVRKLLRSFAGVETGTSCRTCGDAISRRDFHGQSESVCRPCRSAA